MTPHPAPDSGADVFDDCAEEGDRFATSVVHKNATPEGRVAAESHVSFDRVKFTVTGWSCGARHGALSFTYRAPCTAVSFFGARKDSTRRAPCGS